MDIPRALAFSRYATHALAADPGLAETLVDTLARPFAWDNERAALTAIAAEDNPGAHAIGLRG